MDNLREWHSPRSRIIGYLSSPIIGCTGTSIHLFVMYMKDFRRAPKAYVSRCSVTAIIAIHHVAHNGISVEPRNKPRFKLRARSTRSRINATGGIAPVSLLLERSRVKSFDRSPRVEGMTPADDTHDGKIANYIISQQLDLPTGNNWQTRKTI